MKKRVQFPARRNSEKCCQWLMPTEIENTLKLQDLCGSNVVKNTRFCVPFKTSPQGIETQQKLNSFQSEREKKL